MLKASVFISEGKQVVEQESFSWSPCLDVAMLDILLNLVPQFPSMQWE